MRALIGLGSNLGDRKAILDAAVSSLRDTPGVESLRVSRYHETDPVGGPSGQGPFLNAAAALETTRPPKALLQILRSIETQAGRLRRVRWGERTLDLDLLLFGDQCIETPELTVPHPRMAIRRFVLAPLAEIARDAVDPLTRRTIADLLANLDRRPSYLALGGPPSQQKCQAYRQLVKSLNAIGLAADPEWWTWNEDSSESASLSLGFEMLLDRWHSEPSVLFSKEQRSGGAVDRWLVSDFWCEDLFGTFLNSSQKMTPPLTDQEARVRGFLRNALTPTLVIRFPPDHPDPATRAGNRDRFEPIPPQLHLEPGDLNSQIDEILAACASTRG